MPLDDLYANPDGDGAWLKYDYVFKNGQVDVQYCYEGQFTPLTSEGGNRKYTHHPVLLCLEMSEMKSFRHLTKAEIVEYVKKHKHERGRNGRWGCENYQEDFEVWPERTIKEIMVRSGISCICCDEMVIQRREIDEDDYSVAYEIERELENRNTACWLNDHYVPALCSTCATSAKVESDRYYFGAVSLRDETYLLGALKGLIQRKYGRSA